jgi:hypothetical protein
MPDVTITIPNDQVQRIRDAFTVGLELEEPATLDDLKAYIIADIKQFVRTAERAAARRAAEQIRADDPELT